MKNFGLLRPSVISSSSARDLTTLFHEVGLISGVKDFDLLVPRPCDLPKGIDLMKRLSWLMANETVFAKISQDLLDQLQNQSVSIPALATFFPDISSSNDILRGEAVAAVINSFRLARKLMQRGKMSVPIVEIVCGTIVEASSQNTVNIFGVQQKLDWLIGSLEKIVIAASEEFGDFAIALELEPGEIYLLNDDSRIRQVFERCSQSGSSLLLNKHVGLNVDIAHMRIAGVSAQQLEPFLPRICHAHVSDHPGIHTHDQFVGNWTNVEQRNGGYLPYLQKLLRRSGIESSIPFSNCIAIELEGCNRISWIHDSISRLRHAITLAASTMPSTPELSEAV